MNLWNNMVAILKAPLDPENDIDPIYLFLITGLVIVFIVVWIIILNHIRSAANEVI